MSTNVVARYATTDDAQRALAALREAAFAGDVTLLGGARPTTAPAHDGQRRRIDAVVWQGLWWGIVGAAAGGGIGALLGLWLGAWPLQVAAWAMFLHIAGTLLGAYAAIADRQDREQVYRSQAADAGAVLLRVRADAAAAARAEALLRASGAIAVSVFEA